MFNLLPSCCKESCEGMICPRLQDLCCQSQYLHSSTGWASHALALTANQRSYKKRICKTENGEAERRYKGVEIGTTLTRTLVSAMMLSSDLSTLSRIGLSFLPMIVIG